MIKDVAKSILRYVPLIYRPTFLSTVSVKWAYRLLLDRDPENRNVVREKLKGPVGNIPNLRRDLMLSEEFARKNPDVAPFPLRTQVITELDNGLRLFVDLGDGGVSVPIVRGDYEAHLLRRLPDWVSPGMTVLDVGANIGFFTLHLASLTGEEGRVIAFEPMEELATLLERSVAENHLDDRVQIERAAAGEREGEMEILSVDQARNQGAAYRVDGDAPDCATEHSIRRVPLRTLDGLQISGRVGFIKLDIEGAEPFCIQGARDVLHRDRPRLLTEVHPVQLERVARCTPADYLNLLRDCGYRCSRVTDSGDLIPLTEGESVTEVITVLAEPE